MQQSFAHIQEEILNVRKTVVATLKPCHTLISLTAVDVYMSKLCKFLRDFEKKGAITNIDNRKLL